MRKWITTAAVAGLVLAASAHGSTSAPQFYYAENTELVTHGHWTTVTATCSYGDREVQGGYRVALTGDINVTESGPTTYPYNDPGPNSWAVTGFAYGRGGPIHAIALCESGG